MSSLSHQITETIEQENIEPTSRAMIRFRFGMVCAGLLVSVAFSVLWSVLILDELRDLPFELIRRLGWWKTILLLIPWWLLGLTLVGILLAQWFFRKLPQGYRYTRVALWGFVGSIPLAIGIGVVVLDSVEPIERAARGALPPHRVVQEWRETKMASVEQGVLVGRPVRVHESALLVEDVSGVTWGVLLQEGAHFKQHKEPLVGVPQRFFGELTDEQAWPYSQPVKKVFTAEKVIPVRRAHTLRLQRQNKE